MSWWMGPTYAAARETGKWIDEHFTREGIKKRKECERKIREREEYERLHPVLTKIGKFFKVLFSLIIVGAIIWFVVYITKTSK